jgi:hypothetical protein
MEVNDMISDGERFYRARKL